MSASLHCTPRPDARRAEARDQGRRARPLAVLVLLAVAAVLADGSGLTAQVVVRVRDKDGNETKTTVEVPKGSTAVVEVGGKKVAEVGGKTAAAAARDEGKKRPPAFTVFAPKYDADASKALVRLLAGDDATPVTVVKSLADAAKADPGVLVVVMDRDAFGAVGDYDPKALKGRRVVGVGYGAAKLFGELGLDVHWGACAHGVAGEPRVRVQANDLLDATKYEAPFFMFDPVMLDTKNSHNDHVFGVFVGARRTDGHGPIDFIALQAQDPKYAVVARQGGHVLVCTEAPADKWSPPFRKFVRATGVALHAKDLAEDAKPAK